MRRAVAAALLLSIFSGAGYVSASLLGGGPDEPMPYPGEPRPRLVEGAGQSDEPVPIPEPPKRFTRV